MDCRALQCSSSTMLGANCLAEGGLMIFTVVSLRCDVRFSTQRPDDGRSVLSFTSLEDILRKAIVTPVAVLAVLVMALTGCGQKDQSGGSKQSGVTSKSAPMAQLNVVDRGQLKDCLLYTSDAADD